MLTRRDFVSAALGTPALGSADPLASSVLDRTRIGAEFFLNTTETRQSVIQHFQRMAETGLTIARIFTLWDQVEPEKGKWDFSRYDWIYDAAAANNILVANTLCAEDPPGWMRTAPFYHAWRDLSNPELRPYSALYLERVIRQYRDHRAHGVWLLQNEPGIREEGAPPWLLEQYAQWLEKEYGSVEAWNRAWYQKFSSFAEVRPPVDPRTAGWADYPSNLDWRRFRCDHLAAQQMWLREQVERHHPGALTHINPPGLTGNMPAGGRDLWKLKPAAHFLGASMHASWHFGMVPRQDFGMAFGFCCDLIRSASAPAPWWVTEMQAGPTIFTGSRPLNPTEGEITRWLWDAAGNGARGAVFWLWHPRTEGNEAGEWALVGANGEATARSNAVRAVAQALGKHAAFLESVKPAPATTAILYNRDALLLYAVDGWRRPTDEIMFSLIGCYKALHRSGVPVDFLDTSQLEAGEASRYRTLYLPYAFALSARSCEAIRTFVRGGGTIWADGLTAWKDEQGKTLQPPPGPLSDVFGFTARDIDAQWDPFAISTTGDKAGELWRVELPELKPPARVLVEAAGGRASAVENRYGSGRAIYFATALTYGYLHRESRQAERWIAAPAIAASNGALRVRTRLTRLSTRILTAPGRAAVVLNNWGESGSVSIPVPPVTRATELLSGGVLPVRAGEISLPLRAGGTAVIAVFLTQDARA